MLVRATADLTGVVSRGLIACSFVCCAFVVLSFGLFALSQASGASNHQVAQLNGGPAPAHAAHIRPAVQTPGQPRRFIDGASTALTSPFRSFIHSHSQWAVKIASSILALLLYGLGLGYLARWAKT
jgi:hypothetical protein